MHHPTSQSQTLLSLERSDKWYLGAAGAALWAPPFPRFLDRPGFWDQAQFYCYPLEPVFAVAVLDEQGREVPLEATARRWRPGELVQDYRGPDGLELTETRTVTPSDCLVAVLELRNGSSRSRRLRVAAWTCQPAEGLDGVKVGATEVTFIRRVRFEGLLSPAVWVQLGLGAGATGRPVAALAEHGVPAPDWALTPLAELAKGRRAGQAVSLTPGFLCGRDQIVPAGWFAYLGLLGRVALAAGGNQLVVAAASLAPDAVAGEPALAECLRSGLQALEATRASWRRFFDSVPAFHCSDPYLEMAYWYRWYGLRLSTIERPGWDYRQAVVCEGIGSFRAPISYSAQCHLRELRWLPSPELAQSLLRTFVQRQREDGSLPGLIPPLGELPKVFYHADWGSAALALHQVHPDPAFLAELYPALARYGAYLEQVRDPDGSGLCEVWNHYETGQEYASRYLFADPQADREAWGKVFRLKGVDASVYAYQTYHALARLATELGHRGDARRWARAARRTGQAVRSSLWDPELEFFVDALPDGLARSKVKAAVGFYPFMTDLAGREHLGALRRHLLEPSEFWTPFPVPSTSADDPLFSADGLWRGVRRNCPWNGRVWPMLNSHVAEALVRAAETLDPELLPLAAEFLHRFVRLLFFDRDPARPNCFEHYHPFTGQPSLYRGIDDYQHSWLVDLIVRFVCGLRVEGPRLEVRPLPMGLQGFVLEDAPWRGHRVTIEWEQSVGLRLWLDGALREQRSDLGPLVLAA